MISTEKIIKGMEEELTELNKEWKRLKEEKKGLEIKIREIARLWSVCNKIKSDLISANTSSTG